jgi:hypothetical protein
MADQRSSPDDADQGPATRSAPPVPRSSEGVSRVGVPRWVKVFGIVGVVLVIFVVVMLLAGHGPGRHLNGGMGGLPGSMAPQVRLVTAIGVHP